MNKAEKHSSPQEGFENRRRFPRLNMNLSVTVHAPNREKFKGVIYDISPDGVQLRFDVNESVKLLRGKEPTEKELRSIRSTLLFDLAYGKSVTHVKIEAQPAYVRRADEDTVSCGMFFSEASLTENKKISDFLFYQLQLSYVDMELKKNDPQALARDLPPPVYQTVLQTAIESDEPVPEKYIPQEIEELVLQMDIPKEQLDPLRDILNRVLSNLKVIQEITRHIDERINLIEQRISRGGGPR